MRFDYKDRLMLFMDIIAVYSENRRGHTKNFCA